MDPETARCLLCGDHEEHQPFLEVTKEGNIELMKFFLEEQEADPLQRT